MRLTNEGSHTHTHTHTHAHTNTRIKREQGFPIPRIPREQNNKASILLGQGHAQGVELGVQLDNVPDGERRVDLPQILDGVEGARHDVQGLGTASTVGDEDDVASRVEFAINQSMNP